MIVAIHQLHYLPWLRYFHKMASADLFIVLDNIQFNKNGWQNRNKIKGPNGAMLLTVPVQHHFAQTLDQVQIDKRQPWPRKHWRSLEDCYRKAPFFKEHESSLKEIYKSSWDSLNQLNYEMFFYFVKALGIRTQVLKSSDLSAGGEATQRLVDLCKEVKATAYLTGAFAAQEYLEENLFKEAGIGLKYHEFECPVYAQQFPRQGFIPELAVVDLLFNCGPKSLEILMSTAKAPELS